MGVRYDRMCRYVGKPVVAYCRGGRRYMGIVRRVTPEAVFLTPFGSGFSQSSYRSDRFEVVTANKPTELEIDPVQWGWGWGYSRFSSNAIIALALFDILAISLLIW